MPASDTMPVPRGGERPGWVRAESFSAFAFLTPKLLLFFAFVAVPFGYSFYLTLFQGGLIGRPRFVGFANFGALFSDGLLRTTISNTLQFMVVNIPTTILVSLLVGVLLSRPLRGLGLYRALIYIPSLLSVTATGLVWKVLLDRDSGPLFGFLKHGLGIEFDYLHSGSLAITVIALITMWSSVGFYGIMFLAGINDIPRDLYEAAEVDGGTAWQSFWHITLPMLRPVMQLVLLLATINAVQVFDVIYVLTQGGPGTSTYTVMWYIYQNVFGGGSIGYAATIGVAVMLVSMLLAGVVIYFTRAGKEAGR